MARMKSVVKRAQRKQPSEWSSQDLAVACLINARRWADAEKLTRQELQEGASARIAFGLALALLNRGKQDEAADVLYNAVRADPSDAGLTDLARKTLLSIAITHINARDWAAASIRLAQILEFDRENPDVQRLQDSVKSAVPIMRLMTGQRAEAAVLWGEAFRKEPHAETAHHLAILYYWWARHVTQERNADAQAHWRKAFGYWSFVVYARPYWQSWRDSKKEAYEPEESLFDELPAHIRSVFMHSLEHDYGDGAPGVLEDLRMDCWIEFEVARVLSAAGQTPAGGPILLAAMGWPAFAGTRPRPSRSKGGLTLGKIRLDFVTDYDGLIGLCKLECGRALAYAAHNQFDRAETSLPRKSSKSESSDVVNLRVFIAIHKAIQTLDNVSFPSGDYTFAEIKKYALQIGKVTGSLVNQRDMFSSAAGAVQGLCEYCAKLAGRVSDEFSNLGLHLHDDGKVVFIGIALVEETLKLQTTAEANTALITLYQVYVSQLNRNAHEAQLNARRRLYELSPAEPSARNSLIHALNIRIDELKQRHASQPSNSGIKTELFGLLKEWEQLQSS